MKASIPLLLALAPAVSAFMAPQPRPSLAQRPVCASATGSTALAAKLFRATLVEPEVDTGGVVKAVGWLGTAGLMVALLLAPGLGGFDMAAPSAKPATTVVKAPSQADLARAKLEDARKAQYTAKRAALEAKQTADQAAAQAKVSMAKASKAAAAVAKEPDSYEGLLQKATTTTSTPAAAVTVAKVEEKVAVDAEAASKAAATKEAAAKATAEKASAALADALKAELKTVS